MSTVTEKEMEVSPEPKNGLESEGSGMPKGPIKDNNLNSPLQVGARKKLFTWRYERRRDDKAQASRIVVGGATAESLD